MFSTKMKSFWTTFWLPMILVKNFNFSLLNIIILIWIIPKGVTHDFGQKIQYFFYLFFPWNKARICTNAVLKKMPFFSIKMFIFQSPKHGIFPRGLTRFFFLEYRETNFPGLFCLKYKLKLEKLPLFNQTMD